jgi:TM2 domain-containing membrane protein YozV
MWYYEQNGNRIGPVDEATMRQLIADRTISIDTLVWTNGMANWTALQQTQLAAGLPVPPPTPATNSAQVQPINATTTTAKDRVIYVLLAIFLGELGIHNFFAGYTNRAILQLVTCLVVIPLTALITCGVGLLLYFPLKVWAIIEACTVTQDANGVRFK